MPDHDPAPDFQSIMPDAADVLIQLVSAKQRLMSLTVSPLDPLERLAVARAYMKAQWDLLGFESDLGREIMRFPWTIHVAGAAGIDKDFECEDDECDNPWCGQVQKCSRCHDVLSWGFSAAGQASEVAAQMLGLDIQKYMQSHFGENPVDSDGPVWFPVGTRIAKRTQGPQEAMFLMDEKDDQPTLGPHEFFLDCEILHDEIAQTIGSDSPPVAEG
jgi:hypothetical protein